MMIMSLCFLHVVLKMSIGMCINIADLNHLIVNNVPKVDACDQFIFVMLMLLIEIFVIVYIRYRKSDDNKSKAI